MARLLSTGYDIDIPRTGVISPENPNGGTVTGTGTFTRDTTNQRTGPACLSVSGVGCNYGLYTPVASRSYYVRFYFKFSATPGSSVQIYGPATSYPYIDLTPSGVMRLNVAGLIGSSGTLSTGVWYRVELFYALNGSTQVTDAEFRLDGTTIATCTGKTATATSPQVIGTTGTLGCYYDDLAVNDSTGSVNNSWIGVGKVALLVPVSDNAVGTGWTLGTGTAISGNTGSTAVKNTPPLGVADLAAGSDPKQIRNASSNANVNYDANLTSYTTAGIGPSDTINAVIPWTCTAAPVVTSAKLGNVGMVSNPAITLIALGAAGTAGAFWQGNAGGTYPTGWKWSPGTLTEAPSVTKGTSPVIRIQQVTASTRIAVVCFLGMYVDYTPFPSFVLPGSRSQRSGAAPHLTIR